LFSVAFGPARLHFAFDMRIQRFETLVAGLLGAVGVVLAWALLSLPARPRGGISVSFVGFSNAASGVITAQFTVSNAFGHKLIFAGGAPQIRLTNDSSPGSDDGNPGSEKGWSPCSHYGYPGNPVFTVAPNGAHTFAVVLSNVDGAVWRVPLTYSKVDSRFKRLTESLTADLGLGVAKPWWYTNTPEIAGLSRRCTE
jgi:hypothetical protein